MDRLRRSFRDSFRRRGSRGSNSGLSGSAGDEANKPQLWSQDEASVRAGTCSFNVKYLGCVEVFDSRGMQVCEDALKILRSSRRSPIRGILYVSGDGLRVVDAENKGLVVDQTIEKVSFCAPDRNHERGFAYVCRDGTTRRWMCHGFHAVKESGERLSHAVGCAFAVCLEKKQRRDRDATNQGILDAARASDSNRNPTQAQPFRRNDFRRATLPERRQDPQNVKPTEPPPVKPTSPPSNAVARPKANQELLFTRESSLRLSTKRQSPSKPPPVKPTSPPSSAVARPKANQELLFTREGSLRLSQEEQSPFKRSQYYSLRLTEQGTKTITPPPHGSGISTAPVISPVPEERSATSLAQQQLQGLHIGGQCNVNGTQATLLDRTFSDTPANAPAGSSLEGGQNQEANRSRADEWLATLASNANAPPGVGNPQMPTSSTSSYDMNGDVDIFGHRSFGNVPRSQSLIAGNSKPLGAGLATQRSLDVGDPFEQRWDALGRISPRSTESTPAKRSYNPFTEESTLVNL